MTQNGVTALIGIGVIVGASVLTAGFFVATGFSQLATAFIVPVIFGITVAAIIYHIETRRESTYDRRTEQR